MLKQFLSTFLEFVYYFVNNFACKNSSVSSSRQREYEKHEIATSVNDRYYTWNGREVEHLNSGTSTVYVK